jgi:hypothetical protein
MDRAGRATDGLPGATAAALQGALERDEMVSHAVPAIGCSLILTDRRLLIVRDGSSFRPRTGIRAWAITDGLNVRAGLVRQGTRSLIVHWDRAVTSIFVRSDRWNDALGLVAELRERVRLSSRRGGAAT